VPDFPYAGRAYLSLMQGLTIHNNVLFRRWFVEQPAVSVVAIGAGGEASNNIFHPGDVPMFLVECLAIPTTSSGRQ
jgi:hypothetical protein